ncbi:hypothetical protein I2492_01045 [Budviciaceae bacterium CWB-B4]|uniref:Uncharacterized protein n=1 Tax=Limnobaculum xujianqingii TaxID=2738837 RepID=A0A9D7AF97_9GAMM|nr:hypothetical protein [Limnobaculum xujianqingii]MBK5071600.1 hypothetical protein [Limnobaculum xujianqingii]MBK5174909.1 hypothetical protein [Limnobaculum xujianqingii]
MTIFSKIALSTVTALSVISLTACDSPKDASEKNFGVALSQYLEKKGQLCLNNKKWPVDISEMDISMQKNLPSGRVSQMAALESVGLVKSEDMSVQGTGFNQGVTLKIKRYTLSDAAKPYLHEESRLCWGQRALEKVVKWEGPIVLGDYQEVKVTYLYKIDNAADWASKPEIQNTFPAIKNAIDGAGTRETTHVLKLTNNGWEAKGLNSDWK